MNHQVASFLFSTHSRHGIILHGVHMFLPQTPLTSRNNSPIFYHITPRSVWGDAKAEGAYSADSLKTEGDPAPILLADSIQLLCRFHSL